MVSRPAPLREVVSGLGHLGVFLAVLGQLLLGAASGHAAAVEVAAVAEQVICHNDSGSGGQKSPPHPHHSTSDCAICPLCQMLTTPGAIIAEPPPVPPARAIKRDSETAWPPARAPPSAYAARPYPRGPPLLS